MEDLILVTLQYFATLLERILLRILRILLSEYYFRVLFYFILLFYLFYFILQNFFLSLFYEFYFMSFMDDFYEK